MGSTLAALRGGLVRGRMGGVGGSRHIGYGHYFNDLAISSWWGLGSVLQATPESANEATRSDSPCFEPAVAMVTSP